MKTLAALFSAADCVDVQSGNVVFRARSAVVDGLPELIAGAIAQRFGYTVPVVLRSADDLRTLVRDNPSCPVVSDPTTLHVAFVAENPTSEAVAALDPDRSPPDRFIVRGRDLYLHCPNSPPDPPSILPARSPPSPDYDFASPDYAA